MISPTPRWPCPVCLGVMMEKAALGGDGSLTVDHCPRCGGIWFELGEVQRLRGRSAEQLWAEVPRRDAPERARCHGCHAHLDRDAERCPACGLAVQLDCPPCQHPMERARHGDLTLDVCRRCKGVWFDHHELGAIWQLQLGQAMARRRPGTAVAGDASLVLLDSLLWAPHLMFYGAEAAGHAIAGSVHALSNAPEALASAVDVAGEAASSVFETIVEVISGLFG